MATALRTLVPKGFEHLAYRVLLLVGTWAGLRADVAHQSLSFSDLLPGLGSLGRGGRFENDLALDHPRL
jgi:hypothetical protein